MLCYAAYQHYGVAAGPEAAQSSSDTVTAESKSEMCSVSASQSLDTRCCALCSQLGDAPSTTSVCIVSVYYVFFIILLNSRYFEQFFFQELTNCKP